MRYFYTSVLFAFNLIQLNGLAQIHGPEFESSPLPVIFIHTNGQEIPDHPRIMAKMGIIYNGAGIENRVTDPWNEYDGLVSIELRGSTSQALFPKKSYRLETMKDSLNELNVSLLGMPRENDWILHGPYSDKSLIRNVLIFQLANRMGRYASRTQLVELILNNTYQGVYVWMEKIKRDKNRVNIAKMDLDDVHGDSLTGGYIVKLDKFTGSGGDGWTGVYGDFFQFDYPKSRDITPSQAGYIEGFITEFEQILQTREFNHPERGYRSYIDVESFIDFIILNEIGRNVDGYRLSTFMYKDRDSRGGKLAMGPIWDFNLAFGNVNYCLGPDPEGWVLNFNSFCPGDGWLIGRWWDKLLTDKWFTDQLIVRWFELRQSVFHTDSLLQRIDRLAEVLQMPQVRNFQQWPVLGEWVWPNAYVGIAYGQEIDYLKTWVRQRVDWMDRHIPQISVGVLGRDSYPRADIYPNPFRESLKINYRTSQSGIIEIKIRNMQGIPVATLREEIQSGYDALIVWDGTGGNGKPLASGIYIYTLSVAGKVWETGKLSKL